MPYRIGRREDVTTALWRLVREDLAKARHELHAHGPREERIHRVRQRLKRVRSLLRAVTPALGDTAADAKRSLSGAARLLAGPRDADAAAASARELRAAARAGSDAGLDRVVEEFDRKAAEAHRHATPVGEVSDRLERVEADLAIEPEGIDGAALLGKAILRSYREGRRAMRRAQSSLATPDLHRWRKAVKDLCHLLRLARKRLPPRSRKLAAELRRLGEKLGLDHDHAMLAERLALRPTGDPQLMRQLGIIAEERRALESEAFAIGAEIYRREPKRLNGHASLT
jgi:CHAD domain-containing protein